MFCLKCGTENEDNAKFCKRCGQLLAAAAPAPAAQGTAPAPEVAETATAAPAAEGTAAPAPGYATPGYAAPAWQMPAKRKLPVKLLVGIGIGAFVLITLLCVLLDSMRTINLNDYLVIETTGVEGYGKATATVDWDAIEEKYGNQITYTQKAREQLGGMLALTSPIEVIKECTGITLDKNSSLKNGDVVSYSWYVEEELSQYVDCKVKYTGGSHTVEGLEPVGSFDAFDGLEVSFSGVAPDGQASFNYTGDMLSLYDFRCETTNGLKNGDTIKVTLSDGIAESCAEKYGKVPAALEKEYTVEGLSSYVEKLSQIGEESLKAMQQKATEDDDWKDEAFGEEEHLKSLTYIGDYLLVGKDPNDFWTSRNALYLVYKAQSEINSTSETGETFSTTVDIYWYIKYTDLKVQPDGTVIVDLDYYETPSNSFDVESGIPGSYGWYYRGYQSLDELYQDVVTDNQDSYNHEDNVSES